MVENIALSNPYFNSVMFNQVSKDRPESPVDVFLDVLVELRSKLEIAESTIQEKEALLNDIHQEFEFFKKESRETQRNVSHWPISHWPISHWSISHWSISHWSISHWSVSGPTCLFSSLIETVLKSYAA